MEMSESEMISEKPKTFATVIFILILIVIAGGLYYYTRQAKTTQTAVSSPSPVSVTGTIASPTSVSELASGEPLMSDNASTVRTVELTGENYRFSPDKLTAKVGETIKVVLTSNDMPHDFVIDELNVKSDTVTKGNATEVTFTPTKPGTFEFYCSVSNHRAMGMVGTLTVTE